MPAESLRDRVAFDKHTTADDGYGGTIAAFAEQFVVAAGFQYLKGGESVLSARLTGTQPVIIRVRKSSQTDQIKTDWRARDARAGTVYNIKSIMPAPINGYFLDIMATSGEAA